MYYDLEHLIKTFNASINDLPTNDEGKHMVAMEEVISYLEYLINDDNYL